LWAIASRLKFDPAYWDREDSVQEGLLRLFRTEQERPGQTVSWYLQDAKHHLQDLLKAGRSVDSAKRRSRRVQWPTESDETNETLEDAAARKADWDPISQFHADDLIQELRCRLSRRDTAVLELSLEDRGTREIAHLLQISSRDVIQRRRNIAKQTKDLGVGDRE
jgi:DNA-directed RNA polymerase specialized sigma24 family protein